MSGFDKAKLFTELTKRGWVEIEGTDRLIPPPTLFANHKNFYIYDAVDLEEMLGEPVYEKLLQEAF